MIIKTCKNCSKVFKIYPYRARKGNGIYCSQHCFHIGFWKNPTKKMLEHIRIAQRIAWRKRLGMKHSDKSKRAISKNRKGKATGDRNPRWRGGISDLRISIHGLPEYDLWRKRIFERDNYTCQDCGKKGCYLEADHYPIPFKDLINGIKSAQEARKCKDLWEAKGRTLCRKCHDKTKVFNGNQYTKP